MSSSTWLDKYAGKYWIYWCLIQERKKTLSLLKPQLIEIWSRRSPRSDCDLVTFGGFGCSHSALPQQLYCIQGVCQVKSHFDVRAYNCRGCLWIRRWPGSLWWLLNAVPLTYHSGHLESNALTKYGLWPRCRIIIDVLRLDGDTLSAWPFVYPLPYHGGRLESNALANDGLVPLCRIAIDVFR